MNTRRATIIIMLITTTLLIIWDIWVYVEPTGGDTISELIFSFAGSVSFIPYACGVLMGHWFWPMDEPPERSKTIPWLAFSGVVVLLSDVMGWLGVSIHQENWLREHPVSFVVVGAVVGHFLWAQERSEK